ncbi:MAG TPA: ATP-binding cassette domain-containing protein, partial [Chitinophagales bacterium]|nr:ATP-binding cassette domain-containing protein [Chitinophagales bacterium]
INILNRFYQIQKGTIAVDGIPIEQYELHALRANIGLVLQDVFLFTGSIYDNITLRNPNIDPKIVEQAARMVGAHEFIEQLPDGYHHKIVERGATLSVGQRQLISFIRALVYNPRILILDEATASIDTQTETLVQAAVETLVKNRTAIVIAHRLSTIQNADYIMVMEKGKMVEFGAPDDLLQLPDGHFKRLYESQKLVAA